MKQFHSIKLTVFVREDEDEQQIRQRLTALVPFDLEQGKLNVDREVATSAEDKPIVILSLTLEKEKQATAFISWLCKALTREQKQLLLAQAPTRLDHGLNFFIRFDKQRWLDRELQITDSGKCFHCKLSLATYPAKWEKGLQMIQELLRA